MPRPEDIAWKFVLRLEGKRWRCPYCHKESSGSVTRVKSHFLKQAKEGIAYCTKVPEHIRTLMELLLNHEVRNKEDIAWKFVNRLEDSKWRCHYCSVEFSGDLTGMKGHLLGVPNEGTSICTQVLDHVRALMLLLLDEVAEEESRGANGQSAVEPESCGMPTQAEVAEEESREANGQSFTEPQSRAMLPQPEVAEEESIEANIQSSREPQSCDMPTQAEVVAEEESREANGQFSRDRNKEDIAWKFVDRLEDNRWCCHYCSVEFFGDLTGVKGHLLKTPIEGISICTEVPDHIRKLMRSLLDEVAEEESREVAEEESREVAKEQSREAHGQSSIEHNSRDMPSQAEVAEEESRDASSQFFTEPQRPLFSPEIFSPNSLEQWVQSILLTDIGVNSDQQSQPERQFHKSATVPLLVQSSHGESSSCSAMALVEAEAPHDLRDQSQCNIRSQMQMNVQQTPAGASASQYDQICALGDSNCLQDSNQHSQLQIPMDIDPSIASQHTIDSHVTEATIVDLQIPEVATNTTGPSSSQDMNKGSPIMNVQSISANDQEIRNLKRKVQELDDKEAVIKEQMEIESAASSVRKKPRILVERWLKEIERARNDFQIIGQAHAETLPPKEQVETLTREVEELIRKPLPQTLLIEERGAKGVKFRERKLTGLAIHWYIELIWDLLTENHACKLGIYGMGGVGKTTIMMHIHNRLLEVAAFNGVVFVTVSKDFSIYKLQSDIWKALKLGVMEDEHEKKRATMLLEQLEIRKKCVLILDDVWECFDLEDVGIPVRADGFKLVLTTRSFDVCRQMQCQKRVKIKPLSQKEGESLFLEELGSEVILNLEIKDFVESIVKECAGLPIGVITMARSMRGVTDLFEWRDSLVKLKESSMGQTDMEKKVLMNLKFSYDCLGNPVVQQCFLSCALYPEDESINRFELVEFFIDQGLIGGLNTRKEQYDRGLTILNQLENACLLEAHESEMKMHDLIRDMALHIMSATSIVKARKGLTRIPPLEYWMDALEKVSLMENEISEFPLNMSPNCPKLSTLLLNRSLSVDVAIPDSFFKQLCELKVLNLSGCKLIELPNSIFDLVNLRALLLRECTELHHIPYLGKLTSLRKLDVRGCESLEALEGLEKLVNLRYLDLTETHIERLPEGTLECLLNLQCLKVSVVNEEVITKFGTLETFGCYPENVNDFNECVRIIEQSNNCYYYDLNKDQEISGFIVEVSDDVRLVSLGRRVNVMGWGHAIVSVGGECTGIFILIPRDVQTMIMRKCDGITNLSGMGPLEYLEEVEIEEREDLGVLYGGHDEEVIDIHDSPAPTPTPLLFPNLRVLLTYECPKLKYLFGYGSKSNLPHLREIKICDCKEMVGIIAAVKSPPHPLPFFPSLKEIWVESCGKMKRAVESEWMPHFPKLRSISVSKCEEMEEIIRGPPPYLPVEEISLKSLYVCDCNNMRKLFTHEWLLHLRNLQSIDVFDCEGMVEIISRAGQGQDGSIITPVNNAPSSF